MSSLRAADNAQAAVLEFLKGLPASIQKMEVEDLAFVLNKLEELRTAGLSVRLVTEVVAQLGTPVLMTVDTFVSLLQLCLSIYYDQECEVFHWCFSHQ